MWPISTDERTNLLKNAWRQTQKLQLKECTSKRNFHFAPRVIVCINVTLKHLVKSKPILVTLTDRRNNFSQGRSFYKYLEDGVTGFFHIPLRHEPSTKGSDSFYHINIVHEELTPPVRFKYIFSSIVSPQGRSVQLLFALLSLFSTLLLSCSLSFSMWVFYVY